MLSKSRETALGVRPDCLAAVLLLCLDMCRPAPAGFPFQANFVKRVCSVMQRS